MYNNRLLTRTLSRRYLTKLKYTSWICELDFFRNRASYENILFHICNLCVRSVYNWCSYNSEFSKLYFHNSNVSSHSRLPFRWMETRDKWNFDAVSELFIYLVPKDSIWIKTAGQQLLTKQTNLYQRFDDTTFLNVERFKDLTMCFYDSTSVRSLALYNSVFSVSSFIEESFFNARFPNDEISHPRFDNASDSVFVSITTHMHVQKTRIRQIGNNRKTFD